MELSAIDEGGNVQLLRAENEALRQTLLACQQKLRLTEERANRAEELLRSEGNAREAVEQTLLSLERVREQGEGVVKVEMEMRKDLGRDLETAMETVSQLEKQLSTASRKLKHERDLRRKSATRLSQVELELEALRASAAETEGALRAKEQELRLKAGLEEQNAGMAADIKTLRNELAAAEVERRESAQRLEQLQQEKQRVEQTAQFHLLQGQNEARLKEHLQARSAEELQAFRAATTAEHGRLREEAKQAKMAALQSDTALQQALTELRAKEREVQSLGWRVDRIGDLLQAQQRFASMNGANMLAQAGGVGSGAAGAYALGPAAAPLLVPLPPSGLQPGAGPPLNFPPIAQR